LVPSHCWATITRALQSTQTWCIPSRCSSTTISDSRGNGLPELGRQTLCRGISLTRTGTTRHLAVPPLPKSMPPIRSLPPRNARPRAQCSRRSARRRHLDELPLHHSRHVQRSRLRALARLHTDRKPENILLFDPPSVAAAAVAPPPSSSKESGRLPTTVG
jgi:hypothetical protein